MPIRRDPGIYSICIPMICKSLSVILSIGFVLDEHFIVLMCAPADINVDDHGRVVTSGFGYKRRVF